jgi:predicted MFS family arabinose efflux permease
VFLIFAYRHLHLTPGVIGVVFGLSSFGSLVAALVAHRMARFAGVGRALASSTTLVSLGMLCIPLAQLGQPAVVLTLFLIVSQLNWYDIIQLSLRQTITPDRLQGRMNATVRTIVWGTIPIGAFLGGVLGSTLDVVETIVVGGAVSLLSVGWIVVGPVFGIREIPAAASA